MKITDKQPLRGEFRLEKRDLQDNLIEVYEDLNLIVGNGRQNLALLLGSEVTNRFVNTIGFGTNGTEPADGDTALTGSFTKAVGSVTYPETNSVQFAWSLSTSEANGLEIREFGLITAGGTLFARKSRAVISKASDFSLSGTWKIIF